MRTYLFYDLETTGLNKAFDQVMQFAAIRTDEKLNELGRYEYFVKLNPDTLPSPHAIITHRISINDVAEGMSEYEAACAIHKLLNTPGTISLGYNTLGFDDEFLRFTFYRNLLAPYTHQFANQCGRMDLFPMAIMYFLFKPEALNWPEIDGKPSFKLEELNKANNFAEGQAHNAMVDVEATLALARRLAGYKDMWKYVSDYFDKRTDTERVQKFSQEDQALMISSGFGAKAFYQAIVHPIGTHRFYKNQSLWLRLDTEELSQSTLDNFVDTTFVKNKKFGETDFLLPIQLRFMKYITADRQALIRRNRKWLLDNKAVYEKIVQHYLNYTHPEIENIDIEAALYQNGFPSDSDMRLCEKFHRATPKQKVEMLEDFSNPAHKELALRLLHRNFQDLLPDEIKQQADESILKSKSLVDYRQQAHTNKKEVEEQIKHLLAEGTLEPIQKQLLQELQTRLK